MMTVSPQMRHMSAREFALLGLEALAYVKPKKGTDASQSFSIHTADGMEVAVVADRELALATVLQNDLIPVSVH
ncbi:MAG: DUF1150 family protein [Alphaproteobacteria bacterium]